MKKTIIISYVLIIVAFLLVTFFGLGPVLFSDGTTGERIITLAGVTGIYVLLVIAFMLIRKYLARKV